jgi:hypothetical protein
MRVAYYSLVSAGDNFREQQLVQSIRSLRRYNRDCAVFLIAYGSVPEFLLDEARRCDIAVCNAGGYEDRLRQLHVHGNLLARNPTFHKLLSLRFLPLEYASQVLYLDCDTFFFGDVGALFERYQSSHWYAREEPNSRRSHYGYDPRYLDESILQHIAQQECMHPVAPYNTGVCLLNYGLWWPLVELEITYLELAWRLLVGLQLQRRRTPPDEQKARREILEAADDFDRARALPFPSGNSWIVEEIALWLTLGRVPDLWHDVFQRRHVMQGGEYFESPELRRDCIVAHYFSNSKTKFFSELGKLGG